VGFVELVHAETFKTSLAPSNAFVLVEWCSVLLEELTGTDHWERWGLQTIDSTSRALELCLSESSRHNVRRAGLVVTRRGLRKVFSKKNDFEKLIEEAVKRLSAKGSHPSARSAIMLGVIAGVCARKPWAKKVLSTLKSEYYTFYNREIIGSRSQVPPHLSDALADFFVDFTTKQDVEKEIIPALEKALLRAPEIVLNDLVSPLFKSLPNSIDLSTILKNNLLKPLLANMKSTNATIRHGSLSAFKAAVLKSHDDDIISQIAEEIITPLKTGKLTSADGRSLHADMLAILPVSKITVTKFSPIIAAVANKEANESALISETSALVHYLSWALANGVLFEESIVDIFIKGLSDKRVPVRKLWTIRLGELFWSTTDLEILNSKLLRFAESAVPALVDIWQEILANPLAAAQSGLVTVAYIFTAISLAKLNLSRNAKVDAALKKAQISGQSLTMEPKPSFLLNPRIYSKLTTDDDFKWFIRALAAVSKDLDVLPVDSPVALGWAQAMIFCVCSSSVKPATRKEASRTLSMLYIRDPRLISGIILAGLWRWRHSIETGEKDSAAAASKSENQNLHLIIKSICLFPAEVTRLGGSVDQATIKDQMVSLLVIARPELLPKVTWIDVCLRVQVDPGELAQVSGDALIQQILDRTSFDQSVSTSCRSPTWV
jgi:Generalcontrol nonderepressible 1 (Gcn1) N-terminal